MPLVLFPISHVHLERCMLCFEDAVLSNCIYLLVKALQGKCIARDEELLVRPGGITQLGERALLPGDSAKVRGE